MNQFEDTLNTMIVMSVKEDQQLIGVNVSN